MATIETGGAPVCECGEATGVRCEYDGPASALVDLDYVPEYQRGTAKAAGSWAGLSTRLRVSPACATAIERFAPSWCERVEA
jgi:hypothetical protein